MVELSASYSIRHLRTRIVGTRELYRCQLNVVRLEDQQLDLQEDPRQEGSGSHLVHWRVELPATGLGS